ncbi:MAG: ATP-binding cassette domain-containing protein, partial [Kurthia sp.]|nr:ATP-binding cassette domain-containing protein [Candidatus Kurthia equi]
PYTVKENIRLGDINKNEDTIEFVGREANVNSFVDKFPNRYDTFLGKILEDGEDLSGGQWQKLALARALFKEGEIYILDEPTAALDPLSELEIFEKFEFITKSKTSFFISHRIASTKFADRILVFKEGEIIENGSHKELMELKGEYYKLYEAQSKWYSTSELVTNI